MSTKQEREKWERMGLCIDCGGLRLEPKYRRCAKCRELQWGRIYGKGYTRNLTFEELFKVQPEIRKNHKCWNCEWRRFEGDRFFCPFVEGTCIKNGTVNNVL